MLKFNCPHCQKSLKVKDELAGKKAKCPGCQKVMTIPGQAAPVRPAVDVEALAAAALTDQPPPASAPVEEKATLEFTCPNCDEKVQVSADLAGKQAPCPACRRIVKVPLPVKHKPTDWRKTNERLPSGARRDTEPAPEGAWGTASVGRVSSQALLEADAIPVVRERVTVRQWIVRVTAAAAAIALIAFGVLGMIRSRSRNQQSQALARALSFLPKPGAKSALGPEDAGEIYRGAGEYRLRAGLPDDASKEFRKARAELARARADSAERTALLVDVALAQVDLGGDKKDVLEGRSLTWDAAQQEIQQTVQLIASPDGRAEAVRRLASKLIAKNQVARAISIVYLLGHRDEEPELLATVGLELVRGGQDGAQDVLRQAAAPYEVKPARGSKSDEGTIRPSLAPSVVALLIVLDQQVRAEKTLAPPRTEKGEINESVRAGYVQGWAQKGNLENARALAFASGAPLQRFASLLALAAKDPEWNKDLEAAVDLLHGGLQGITVSPWLLLQLVHVALEKGYPEARLQKAVDGFGDAGVRSLAQGELMRSRLAKVNHADPELLSKAASDKAPNTRILEMLARHDAGLGGAAAVMKAVEAWQPETVRPFGYMGVALGVQDRGR